MDMHFNHLVLLIGTNPLPNFVVSKYFLNHVPTIQHLWLVHSEKTKKLADNISKVLREIGIPSEDLIRYVPLEDVGSAIHITHDIKEKLIRKLDKDSLVHFNYTGGTKAMAVHVYRALERAPGDRCTFSYLDSREYVLRGDDGTRLSRDLRSSITLSLDHLIQLHGYEKEKKEEQDNPDWPEVITKFKSLIDQGKLDGYLKWAKEFLRSAYYRNGKFIKKKNQFIKHNEIDKDPHKFKNFFFKNTQDQDTYELLKSIPSQNSLLNQDGSVWIPDESVTNKAYQKRLKSVKDFLDGKWLEVYVGHILDEKLAADEMLKGRNIQLELNWEIWSKSSSKPFEIDVIVLNGYQLCGVSVTTSKEEGTCKIKGFEVLHRVQQMGGEEAKAILITCLPQEKVGAVAQDLITISGSSDEKLLVLGKDDLRETRLWQKIKNHIWGN